MYYFSHHNEESETYDSHVFTFRGTDFCIGCFTNKFFLAVLFPVLYFTLMSPRYEPLLWTTVVLYAVSIPQYLYEYLSGNKIWNKPLRYTAALFQLVAVSLTIFSLSMLRMDSLLLLTSLGMLPQYLVYGYKIVTQKEFTHTFAKFVIRLGYVVSLFFGLGIVTTRPLTALLSLSVLFYLFVRLRALSTYRVEGDYYVFHKIGAADSKVRKSLDEMMNGQGGLLVLSTLFIFGLVSLSFNDAPTCTRGIGLISAFPFLSRGFSFGDVDNFCENCGTKRRGDSLFCQNCGTRFEGVEPKGKALDTQGDYGDPVGQSPTTQGVMMGATGNTGNKGVQNSGSYDGYNRSGYSQGGYTGRPNRAWSSRSHNDGYYYRRGRRRRSRHHRNDTDLLCWICCFLECCMD